MASDLFVWLDALWNKRALEGAFPAFIAHRFLASERDFAEAARTFGRELREPALIFRTWQGALPEGRGAPRLSYPAPKKAAAAEALTQRMMAVRRERRTVVEEEQGIVALYGRLLELYYEFGVEPPEEILEARAEACRGRLTGKSRERVEAAAATGLLDTVRRKKR